MRTIHIASHVIHYGSGVFEGARCYETPKGSACFRLDAHMRRLQRLRQDLPDGVPARSAPAGRDAVLDTIRANEMKACYIRPIVYRGYDTLGVNPLPCPVDAAILLWEWGAYLGAGSARAGRRREGQLVVAHGAEHAAGDGEERGQLRELRAHQDGSARRRLHRRASRSTSPATSAKAAARTSSSSATASSTRRRSASSILGGITRDSVITLARDLGYTVTRGDHPARDALHRRRGVLRRHGGRGHADPVGRQDHDRRRPPRARSPRRSSSAFFDVINGEVPDAHGWLTYVYADEAPLRDRRAAPWPLDARAEGSGSACTSTIC